KEKKSAPAAAPAKKIIGTATDLGRFSELANAMAATGLAQVLGEDGPFVIFAPNDEAFAKIDPAQKSIFFKPENKQKLINVMKLHVTKGRSTIESLEGTKVVTFNGKLLPIKKTANGFTVGKANVVKANIAATNGMIHEIDAVLLPADY
ncbi:MAG: fasciclin domain-containing protein, partial [Bacteroidia bacterium]|nr:fasciclin domain-containing protein [Bacteroidia bacterium]